MRFALLNSGFGPPCQPVSPSTFDVGGHRLVGTPHEDYDARYERFGRYGGVLQTAWCDVSVAEGTTLDSDAATYVVQEVLVASSLAVGSRATWSFFEGFDAA